MLRKIRILAALICFLLITLLFLDFTGSLHAWFGWLAKIQFLPALLAMNVVIVLGLVVLTLLFGRAYCSVICPLGVFQDIVSGLHSRRGKGKYRFSHSPALSWLRYGVLAIFIVALLAGISSFAALLAPYSSYGRIAQNLFAPIYGWCNNALAYFAERIDSYAFYTTDVWLRNLPTFLMALATFIIIAILAWRNGRTYCNTICPVGTVLGVLSRFAWLRPRIDTSKCNRCGLCARSCKAACIDAKEHRIDYSRCVDCMDCIEACSKGAIYYGRAKKEVAASPAAGGDAPTSRRQFLITAGVLMAGAVEAQEKKIDGGLAPIIDKKIPSRATPLVPPGAGSLQNLRQHCTACQLCVSVCPTQVLRPSGDLSTFMQPEMSYERGYCRPECTKCSEVCPTGAIHLITREEKSATKIGHAVVVRENCIPLTDGVSCGNCARHCPTGAIQMVKETVEGKEVELPVVNTEKCIGCGACENLCPSRPFSAIYVEGVEQHRII